MKYEVLLSQYNLMLDQRKKLLVALGLSLSAVVVLSAATAYKMLNPTIVIVPPIVDSVFKVQGNRLSATGLEQHANYFAHLYLDITPETIDKQHHKLVQYVHPDFQVNFKKHMNAHIERVKRLKVTSRFDIDAVDTDVDAQIATLKGKISFYQGPALQNKISKEIRIGFKNKLGQPYITSINEVEND